MIYIKDLTIGDRIMVAENQNEFPIFFMEEFIVIYAGAHPVTGQYIIEIRSTENDSTYIELDKESYTYFDKVC